MDLRNVDSHAQDYKLCHDTTLKATHDNCYQFLKSTRSSLPACNITSRMSAGAAHQTIGVSGSNRPPVAGIGHAPLYLLLCTGNDSRQDVSAGRGGTDFPFSCPYWEEVRECLDLHPLRLEIYKVGKATVFSTAVHSDRQVKKFRGISSLHLHESTKLLDVASKVAIKLIFRAERSQTTPTEVFKSQQPYPHYCTIHYVRVDESETQQTCAVTDLATGIKTDIIIPFPGKLLKTRQVRQEEVGQFGIITVAMETPSRLCFTARLESIPCYGNDGTAPSTAHN